MDGPKAKLLTCAILIAAFVEEAIGKFLKYHLLDENEVKELFDGNSPHTAPKPFRAMATAIRTRQR
jgi:hypothetical protein